MPDRLPRFVSAVLRPLVLALAAVLGLALAPAGAGAQEILQPDPAFSPKKVVSIQLKALQRNDTPEADAGIRQTWAFAHPANRRITGPYPRFRSMIKMPSYDPLLGHSKHLIEQVEVSAATARFAVTVTARNGKVYAYQWEVRRIEEGEHAGAWATTAVSPPMDAGDST